jgi:hypothetical protein
MAVYTYITARRKETEGHVSSDVKVMMRPIERRLLPFPEREPHGAFTPTSASEHALIQ